MKDNPLFSVLIANYNNGRFLQEAIDSVLAQTYSNWEVVIVDDGSTDESRRVYDQFKEDDRIRVYYNGDNKGCGYTKKHCAKLAKGEVCGFLDPDDVILAEALELSVENLKAHPSAVLSLSRCYYCDENLKVTGESRLLQMAEGESYLEHGDYGPEAFAAFRRDAYLKTDGINPYLKAGVDQDLYFRLEEQGDVVVLDKKLYKYRLYNNSVSAESDYAFFWNMKARFDACERRGIVVDKNHPTYLSFKERLDENQRNGADSVRMTYAYRIGRCLLRPFSWLKRSK